MNPIIHSKSSARSSEEGGLPPIHEWFDETKKVIVIRGIGCYGITLLESLRKKYSEMYKTTTPSGKPLEIPTRLVAEQHVREDCGGRIPSVQDWVMNLRMERWMNHISRVRYK